MSSTENRSFRELLDELIDLYKKLQSDDKFKSNNIQITGDVDFLLSNYEMVKNSLPEDAINEMGEPIRSLLEGLIKQLRNEISRDEVSKSNQELIDEIDQKLANSELSPTEIDSLLDQRSKLRGVN